MTHFRMLMDDTRFLFKDRNCIGRRCFSPGIVQSGSLQTACCVISAAEDGCPASAIVDQRLVDERRKEGWVVA